jgi:hypothetical protein
MPAVPLIIAVCLSACALVGVWGVVWPRRALTILAAVLAAIVLALAAVEGAINGFRQGPLLIFAVVLPILLLLRAEWFGAAAERLAAVTKRFPRGIYGIFVAGAAVCLIDLLWTGVPPDRSEPANLLDQEELVRLIPAMPRAKTDANRPVRLFHYGEPVPSAMTEMDEKFISLAPGGLLFLGYPGGCNCHGFVFAGSQYWIMNDSVPAILKDNGYEPVSEPAAGDLIIYWDEAHNPVHSGIVQAVPRRGPIRIESKWGMRGEFLHTPQAQIFSQTYSYLRSSRHGHLLHGLDEPADSNE